MTETNVNDFSTTLDGAIDDDDTTLTVNDSPPSGLTPNFRIRIEDEIMLVTAIGGTGDKTWTVTREVEEPSRFPAASHANGIPVHHVLTVAGLGGFQVETWDTVMAALSGKVHRWTFEESSGYPQDSVGSLHMTTGGGTVTRQIASPLGYGMSFTASVTGSGNGSAPMGNADRTFVQVVKTSSSTNLARDLLAYGPTGSTRQWNHTCFNHDNIYQGPCILFWSDDHKPGGFGADGNWHMIVAQYGGRAVNIWMDGTITSTSATGANLNTTNSGNLALCAGDSTVLTDTTIFNRWLTRSEIYRLWDTIKHLL